MINRVHDYCTNILLTSKCANLAFHNVEHTKEVVNNVNVISDYIGLTVKEKEPIVIAAWFHDTGHSERYQGHEDVSERFIPNNKFHVVIPVSSCN